MKKLVFVFILVIVLSAMLPACGRKNEIAGETFTSGNSDTEGSQNNTSNNISKEMTYKGVDNYCHSVYDWSVAEDNPDIMYLKMGEETESEYQMIFRSYTGAFVYFYVNKLSGTTRLIEYVPNLDIEEEAGTINLYDYLESDEK